MSAQKRIESLGTLKLLALFLIICLHAPLPKLPFAVGARTCEFLFICSGFLVAYNYALREVECSWKESFKWFFKKLIIFWPLHFIILTINLNIAGFNGENFIRYLIKLFFLDIWSNNFDILNSLNGPAWFLSNLMLCYFLAPFFLKLVKTGKKSVLLFSVAVFARFFIEIVQNTTSINYLNISLHCSPVARVLEFLIGMLSYPLFKAIKDKVSSISKPFLTFSILEFCTCLLSVFFLLKFDKQWSKAAYCLLSVLIILVFAFDAGFISKLLSLKIFKFFGKYQFELYLIHISIINYTLKVVSFLHSNYGITIQKRFYVPSIFILIFILAFIYKEFCADFCSGLLKKGINKINKSLDFDIEL